MAKIIAFTNQKGGVGKTSVAFNFSVALGMTGASILLVDMDPQCSLTYAAGVDEGDAPATILEVLLGQVRARDAVVHAKECDLLCGSYKLSAVDTIMDLRGQEFLLRAALRDVADRYDVIVLDSPPTLGLLTINILAAADEVIIPALADVFSLQGIGQLYSTVQSVRRKCNPSLRIVGIVLSRYVERFLINRDLRGAMERAAEQIDSRVFKTVIRESVALREAQAKRQSIFRYHRRSRQAGDYENLVMEYLSVAGYMKKQ